MKPLLDLANNDCRWPMTADKPFLFCGEPKAETGSYCACHKVMSVSRDQPKGVPGGFVLFPRAAPATRAGLRQNKGNSTSALTGHRTPVDVHMRQSMETATILQEAAE